MMRTARWPTVHVSVAITRRQYRRGRGYLSYDASDVPTPHPLPPPCGQTDTRENITFPQLRLREVIIVTRLKCTEFLCKERVIIM